jgi:hypothetical protein
MIKEKSDKRIETDSENSIKKSKEKNEELEFPVLITILTEIFSKKEENKKCICHNYIEVNKDNINDIYEETELIPSVRIRIIRNENEKNFQIRLNDICNSLKRLGYPMGGSMINIYLNEASDYIFYGPDPIDHNICINSTELGKGNLIKIKIVNYLDKKILSNVYNKTDETKELDENDEESELNNNDDESNNKNSNNMENNIIENDSRRRERRIGYIIEKVHAWRKLYNGFYDEKGEHTRYSLDHAAKQLGISKKSLDDYLLQIRLGRKFGFDFNKNRNERVGNLREFVKKNRKKEEQNKNNNNDNNNYNIKK